mmetsp:Transcript_20709/g.52578  ORF Transcript_20709/g.52578 Transcript_20709/m.52578 type:complete len:207 (-) Transcript_20709:1145-1765(-)
MGRPHRTAASCRRGCCHPSGHCPLPECQGAADATKVPAADPGERKAAQPRRHTIPVAPPGGGVHSGAGTPARLDPQRHQACQPYAGTIAHRALRAGCSLCAAASAACSCCKARARQHQGAGASCAAATAGRCCGGCAITHQWPPHRPCVVGTRRSHASSAGSRCYWVCHLPPGLGLCITRWLGVLALRCDCEVCQPAAALPPGGWL